MAKLIVTPDPQDINVVQLGLELLGVAKSIERAGITWRGVDPKQIIGGFVFGIWQNVDSVRKLLAATAVAGVHLPTRGAYRFLASRDHDVREVLRAGIHPAKTRPSDLLIIDESANQRTGRRMEGTSLVHSTTARRRVLGHCLLNTFHSGAEVSGFVDFEMKMNRKTKAGYRRRGHPSAEVSRALNTPLRALALAMIDREIARGNQADTVVTDSGFLSLAFCRRLRRRGRHWVIAGKVDTTLEYKGTRQTLRELFSGVRSLKSAGDSVRYRVLNVVYPGYGPIRAFYARFVDRHGEWHDLYLLTDLTKRRSTARGVLRRYLRRWGIETGHRQTKETFNLLGYHGHTLHGHINFYALVLLAHQVAEAVLHEWNLNAAPGEVVRVPTLAFRVRLATMQSRGPSPGRSDQNAQLLSTNGSIFRSMMGTGPASNAPGQSMMGSPSS